MSDFSLILHFLKDKFSQNSRHNFGVMKYQSFDMCTWSFISIKFLWNLKQKSGIGSKTKC